MTVEEQLDRVEQSVRAENNTTWMLKPNPIKGIGRLAFKRAVVKARVQLIHSGWATALEAARELSDAGGVLSVDIYRIVHRSTINSTWIDGKQR